MQESLKEYKEGHTTEGMSNLKRADSVIVINGITVRVTEVNRPSENAIKSANKIINKSIQSRTGK